MIYKKLYGFEFGDDLSVFDEIINTDELGPDQVLERAKTAVKNRYGAQTARKS